MSSVEKDTNFTLGTRAMGYCKLRPAFLAVQVSPDGSPLAVFRASCLTSSILHKQALLMFKNFQRTSQTNWRKSEVSHGTQGLPHSSSLNNLHSYHRFQRTWKPIHSQTHPSLPSFRAFAHDISSAWRALPSPVPPVELHFFPRKPRNRRRALGHAV